MAQTFGAWISEPHRAVRRSLQRRALSCREGLRCLATRLIALGLTALVFATTSLATSPIYADPEPRPVNVLDAFVDALNTRALDRAQALLADDATISDERGEYVGNAAREWLMQTARDGIHVRLLSMSRLDTNERSTGDATSWFSFAVTLQSELDRNLGFAPHTLVGSAILDGSTIHSFRLQRPGSPSASEIDTRVPPTESPGEGGSLSAPPSQWTGSWTLGIILSAGAVALGVVTHRRRVRGRTRAISSSHVGMLPALHQATLRRRAAGPRSPERASPT
jgi:hypothetical protein